MPHPTWSVFTGAEALLRTLTACGVEVCFMNPGTSEMQFVAALDRVLEMRGVLGLHETVCAGAADGYARMAGRPAAVLLHLGPGLANAISNLHNARKARSPLVALVGEHATQHLAYDAPLTADIEALARPVSRWVGRAQRVEETGRLAAECVAASLGPPGGVATLVIPADLSWTAGATAAAPLEPAPRRRVEARRVSEARRRLAEPGAGLLLSGASLQGTGLELAARLRAHFGVPVFADRYAARLTRGQGVFPVERLAYFPEPAWKQLAGRRLLLTVEAARPVSFFGYPGLRSELAPEGCEFFPLATEQEDALDALAQLAGELPPIAPPASAPGFGMPEDGPLTLDALGQILAHLLPADAIVSDEMVSSGETVNRWLAAAPRHDLLPVTGGSIGQGLPVALGAAVACPDRKVVCLEADGSGMYSLQALWSMARERLNVLTVVLANRRYRILDVERARTNSGPPGERGDAMLDLRRPELDWVALARGMGVQAARAEDVGSFRRAFQEGRDHQGPFLIEAVLPAH